MHRRRSVMAVLAETLVDPQTPQDILCGPICFRSRTDAEIESMRCTLVYVTSNSARDAEGCQQLLSAFRITTEATPHH
jgi:hypothetical protein